MLPTLLGLALRASSLNEAECHASMEKCEEVQGRRVAWEVGVGAAVDADVQRRGPSSWGILLEPTLTLRGNVKWGADGLIRYVAVTDKVSALLGVAWFFSDQEPGYGPWPQGPNVRLRVGTSWRLESGLRPLIDLSLGGDLRSRRLEDPLILGGHLGTWVQLRAPGSRGRLIDGAGLYMRFSAGRRF